MTQHKPFILRAPISNYIARPTAPSPTPSIQTNLFSTRFLTILSHVHLGFIFVVSMPAFYLGQSPHSLISVPGLVSSLCLTYLLIFQPVYSWDKTCQSGRVQRWPPPPTSGQVFPSDWGHLGQGSADHRRRCRANIAAPRIWEAVHYLPSAQNQKMCITDILFSISI